MIPKFLNRTVFLFLSLAGWTSCGLGGGGHGDPSHPSASLAKSESAGRPKMVSYEIVFQDGTQHIDQIEISESVYETQVGPLRLTVIWEQFRREMAPTPTVLLRNTFLGSGVVRWVQGSIRVDEQVFDLGNRGCIPPRYCLIQSALTLAHWRQIRETADLPSWIRDQALDEIEAKKQVWVGPYQLWSTDGTSYAPGGHGVAPYHGGAKDWLAATAEGKARRFAEAIGMMSLGIWLDYDPAENGQRYWWDASAIEYAPEGFQWSPSASGWCSYEQTLAQRPIPDISHGRRFYGAVAALAPYSKVARYFLMEAIWPEIKRSYSMDRRMPGSENSDQILYSPLWQILELTAAGGPYAPPIAAPWGNRREAHAINVLCEALPYMSERDREVYVPAWSQLLSQLDDGRGVLDRTFSGDAESSSGLPPPACMAFQQQLLSMAARQLGGRSPVALEVGNRIARWWGPFPPYYAHTGGDYPSAQAAPHSGQSVADYTWFTHPATVDFGAILEASVGRPFDETPLSCVPPEKRRW